MANQENTQKLQNRQSILNSFDNLIDALDSLEKTTREVYQADNQTTTVYAWNKQKRQAAKSRKIRLLRELDSANKVKTEICPCGQHRGIRFIDNDNTVLDELCPLHWWIDKSWLALEDGKLGQFLETPLQEYLKFFRLS